MSPKPEVDLAAPLYLSLFALQKQTDRLATLYAGKVVDEVLSFRVHHVTAEVLRWSGECVVKELDQSTSEVAILVEVGVEDGDVDTLCAAGGQSGGKNGGEFFPAQPVGVAVIDRWHEVVVEHVDVDVDPEPIELVTGDHCERVVDRLLETSASELGEVDGHDGRVVDVHPPTGVRAIGMDPIAQYRHPVVGDKRMMPTNRTEPFWASSGR